MAPEVGVGEIEEVQPACQLHPCDADEIHGQQGRDDAEDETANETVAKGFLVLRSWKTQHHDRHDERVVGAQQAFEGDESADCYEIGYLYVQDRPSRSYLETSAPPTLT